MRTLKLLFIILIYCTQFATAQFTNGTQISIQTDTKEWISRCKDCQEMNSNIPYTASSHWSINNAARATETFTVVNKDGKIALKADNGGYLKACYNCAKENPNSVISVESLPSGASEIPSNYLFKFEKQSDGSYTIQSSNGRYWTRYYRQDGKKKFIATYRPSANLAQGKFKVIVQNYEIPVRYVSAADRGNGATSFNFEKYLEDIKLENIEGSQTPTAFLSLETQVGLYRDQRYININMASSRVSASSNGKILYDELGARGWYLEYVDVQIECLTPGFRLANYGPHTDQAEGSVTSSSGVNLSTGSSISSSEIGSSVNAGLNFEMSYSSNLKSFSVQDNSSGNAVKTRIKLTSTIAAETWSAGKGGNVPYQNSKDLLRMDTHGQFGDVPLNYLPDLAKSNLPLASMGTFKAPNNFQGVAKFKVKMIMHMVKVKRTLGVLSVTPHTDAKDYNLERVFTVDFNH